MLKTPVGFSNYYEVALLRSSAPTLTYHCFEELEAGQVLLVPVKSTLKKAVLLRRVEEPDFRTVAVAEVLRECYRSWQMEAAEFIASYYFSSFSEALSLFIPYREERRAGGWATPTRESGLLGDLVGVTHPTKELDPKDHEKERAVGWVDPTRKSGVVSEEMGGATHLTGERLVLPELPVLSDEQRKAYEELSARETGLLFGVTGSGKTELYIHRMAEMLEAGKSSILLMPEIALTPQMEKRLQKYFGDSVAIWHSRLRKKKKEEILDGIYRGKIRIVAGARSALFVPLENLGLIIVDEEHDDSYKAMTRPRYHARDLAVYLGKKLGAQVWLASATPATTSYVRFPVVRLQEPYVRTNKRYRFVPGDTINAEILRALEENFRRGEQSLLFVPTRANFKYLRCDACGKTHLCPYCSVGMSLHRRRRYLRCHYCNYTEPIREACAYCGHAPLTSDRIGTQEAMEIISGAIPGIRVEQFDKDAITTPGKLEKALKRIERGEADVIVGTQMLSKGHDYPNITLSVITGLDYLLGMGDYRAKERAVSLLHQIAGRSGRSKDATILIQSAQEEYFRPYLGDYALFLDEEAEFRRQIGYPPFAHLARILIAHKEEAKAAALTAETVARLEAFDAVTIVGHGPAPIERIAGKARYQILLRCMERVPLIKALHAVDRREIEIDMDPVDFS